MTLSEARKVLKEFSVGRQKSGSFVVRRLFYYPQGRKASDLEKIVRDRIPNALIIESGEVWKPFRGGAPVSQQSHWFVRFLVPSFQSRGE